MNNSEYLALQGHRRASILSETEGYLNPATKLRLCILWLYVCN